MSISGRLHGPKGFRWLPPPGRSGPALLALLLAIACPSSRPEESLASEAAVRRYTVRGEVVRLPAPGGGLREITLRHEAIPGFVGQDGRVVGMESMVMALELEPAVTLDAIRTGDVVEFVLAVDWARNRVRVTAVRPLPPGTVLDLGGAAR